MSLDAQAMSANYKLARKRSRRRKTPNRPVGAATLARREETQAALRAWNAQRQDQQS